MESEIASLSEQPPEGTPNNTWGFGPYLKWGRQNPASGIRISLNDAPIEGLFEWPSGLQYLENGPYGEHGARYGDPDVLRKLADRYGYPLDHEFTKGLMASLYRYCWVENQKRFGQRYIQDINKMFLNLSSESEVELKGRPEFQRTLLGATDMAWNSVWPFLAEMQRLTSR